MMAACACILGCIAMICAWCARAAELDGWEDL